MTAIQGYVDVVSHESITGWACDPARPDRAVVLLISVDGRAVTRVVANGYRQDLELAGLGAGRHGFTLNASKLGLPLGAALVSVQVEATGEHLPRSPWQLEGPAELSAAVREALVALFDTPGSDGDLRERALFLGQQAERLLQRLADKQSGRPARVAASQRKWRWRPEEGPPPPPLPLRALVVDSTLPARGRDAGSHAMLSHMESLQRLGFEVTFVPADMNGGTAADGLAERGIATACAPWTASVEEVLRRQSGAWDLVYLHRVEVAGPYAPLVRRYAPKARVIYSVADLHSLRVFRQAAAENRPELVPYGNHLRRRELAAAAESNVVVTHSPAEAALLRQWLPQVECRVVPWVFPVRPTPAGFDARSGAVFVGSFGPPPNLAAAIWLIDEIMPLVWRQDPAIECLVVGSAMPGGVFEGRDSRVRVLGQVEDLQALLNGVRMTVAPLAYGAGLKGKVGDSLAAGVPCVCTPVAAEGYALPQLLGSLVGADSAALADSIVRLHGDLGLFGACRDAGLAYVAEAFCEEAVDAAMRGAAGVVPAAETSEVG